MLTINKAEYKHFLCENGSLYPYRDVLKTRNRVHVSWLLMERKKHTGYLGRVNGIAMEATTWRCIPSNAFENDTVTYLIMTKQALPVPQDIGAIIEVMECWGKALDSEWYNRVVDYLGYLCWNGFELPREELVHHTIEFRVHLIARRRPGVPYTIVMDRFDAFFRTSYKYTTKRIFALCTSSFLHTEELVNQLVDHGYSMMNVDATVPVTPPSIEYTA